MVNRENYWTNLIFCVWIPIILASQEAKENVIIIIIIIIIIIYFLTYLLTATELSLGGSSPYTSTDKTNKNIYT